MNLKAMSSLVVLCMFSANVVNGRYDLTVVGRCKYADSIGRLPIWVIDCLKDDLAINFIGTEEPSSIDFNDVPKAVVAVIENSDPEPGAVALLLEHPWYTFATPADKVPESTIKIAYSMTEATGLPKQWVELLNKKFDAVAVPDAWLVPIYEQAGVKLPIFVLPCGMYLDEFLADPLKTKPHTIFTFGMSAGFWPWKNHEQVIKAFAREFGSKSNIQLLIHGRNGDVRPIKQLLKQVDCSNIHLITQRFTKSEYLRFMQKLDCYVFLSKGEGFSLTPREAMAMGIPCIISNNTAHKTICDTGLVMAVKANKAEPAYYAVYAATCGKQFNGNIQDAQRAMRELYEHYPFYIKKYAAGREWVKHYAQKELKEYYKSLIKPEKVVFGSTNTLSKGVLTTNSANLRKKYMSILMLEEALHD